jgi:hypothetical protein
MKKYINPKIKKIEYDFIQYWYLGYLISIDLITNKYRVQYLWFNPNKKRDWNIPTLETKGDYFWYKGFRTLKKTMSYAESVCHLWAIDNASGIW